MAYLGSFKIDDLVTFTCNTHTPATGAAVDADAVPGYRIYEDETAAPILTGSMALLDDANTVGFYSEQITLSAANGFEKGKSYNIRITGVVAAVTGVLIHTLQVQAEVDVRSWAGTAVVASAIPAVAAGSVGGLAVIGLNANGYDGGWVWFDTAGAAGAVNYVNGTVLNPCSSMANCRTIANSLNLKGFRIINGSTVTLDQGYNAFTFWGYKWTLALANRLITNSFFSGATVSGTATGTGAVFDNCDMGICTLDPCTFQQCVFTGTITVGTAGNYTFERCQSQLTAGVDPIIDFGAAVGATTINLRSWSGGLSIANMKAGDILEIDGSGRLILAASCTAGTVRIRGNFEYTNNGSGMTLEDTARWNEDQRMANVTLVDTATITTTATNLTNAATAGDFTAVMKTSLNAATPASVVGAVGSVTGAVGSVTGAVGSVTGNVGGNVTGSVGSLAAQAKADVNAEVVDALSVDAYAEPVQGAPLATTSLAAKINFLYKAWRNKKTQTTTTTSIYDDAGAVVDHKATVSDDGVTFTKGEIVSGP